MSFRFNALTGKLDLVNDSTAQSSGEKKFQVIDEVKVNQDSELRLLANAEVIIKDINIDSRMIVVDTAVIENNGQLRILQSSRVEIIGA